MSEQIQTTVSEFKDFVKAGGMKAQPVEEREGEFEDAKHLDKVLGGHGRTVYDAAAKVEDWGIKFIGKTAGFSAAASAFAHILRTGARTLAENEGRAERGEEKKGYLGLAWEQQKNTIKETVNMAKRQGTSIAGLAKGIVSDAKGDDKPTPPALSN